MKLNKKDNGLIEELTSDFLYKFQQQKMKELWDNKIQIYFIGKLRN